MNDEVKTKKCSKCGKEKPLEEFYMRAASSDGRNSGCRKCEYARKKVWWHNTRDQRSACKKAYNKLNMDKRRANAAVYYAIKSGKLVRSTTCNNCGVTDKIESHHEDYSKPLEVDWFCSSCHKKADKVLRIRLAKEKKEANALSA